MTENPYIELIDHVLRNAEKGNSHMVAKIDNKFDLNIILKGDSWDEKLDLRVARFVEDLQTALDRLQSEFYDWNLNPSERELVKVRLVKGSSDITIEISKLLKGMIKDMTSTQKVFLISLAILSTLGGLVAYKYVDYKTEISTKIQDEETKRAMLAAFERANGQREDFERPVRTLVQSMQTGDTIQLPYSADKLDKEAARKVYPRRPRTSSKTDYVDGVFAVTDINYSEDPVTAILEQGDFSFRAEVLLPATQLDSFYEQLKSHHAKIGSSMEMELQVTMRYSGSGIRDAKIVGVGPARTDAVAIGSIIRK